MSKELTSFRIIQGDTGGYGAPSYKCDPDGNRLEEWDDVCEVYEAWAVDAVLAKKDIEIRRLKRALYIVLARSFCCMRELSARNALYEEECKWDNFKEKCLSMAECFKEDM